ncbi:hypothetical protein ACLKA6_009456 [Drosophila palustris]
MHICCKIGDASIACADGVTQCFIKRAPDGTVTRGCLTDTESCQAPACQTCESDNCNFLMCRKCVGPQTGCGTKIVADDKYNQLCAANEVCRNEVNSNGEVVQQCGAACEKGATNCKTCKEDNCNLGIFPEDRLLCYQCSGAACNKVSAAMLSPCALYRSEDACYTYGTADSNMHRGCTSDTNAKCTKSSTDSNCAVCDGPNGCNNRPFERVLGSCIQCSNNDTCIQGQQADKAKKCAASKFTQTENVCYYKLDASGLVSRGCVNELQGQECLATQNCIQCNGTDCNTQPGTFTCLTCRSDDNALCRQAEVDPSPCQHTSLTSPSSMQCFSGEWDGIVRRGCLIDMGPLTKSQCENKEDERCTICRSANCNIKKYNGAATLQHMGLGLMALIFLIRHAM